MSERSDTRSYDVRSVSAERTRQLRQTILRPGQPPENSVYPGDDGPDAFHLGAVDEKGEVIGVASFFAELPPARVREAIERADGASEAPAAEGAVWRLRGMAIAADAQRRGIGNALMREGLDEIRRRGGDLLWCNARGTAVGFYEQLDFAEVGEDFEADGLPHVVMWRRLAGGEG